uniref:Leucine-rich repeat and WD repeat-containing protein KIAA1239-like n=1 Tax=Saccoglossus kowalevskii TaxID=10224 RepID=A0ABM0MIB7_SACKO|nr:PREDICTED: leucine-rich repeat and WD repeat-containing protein KIAA1239-like [Saccoglossus kowalevskii]
MQDGHDRHSKSTGSVHGKRRATRPKAARLHREKSIAGTEKMGCGASSRPSTEKQSRKPRPKRENRTDEICGYLDYHKPLPSRNVRLFVCSTFGDLESERNTLIERVYPRIRSFCRERGYEFQAVDLNFGLSKEDLDDDPALSTRLETIKKCQHQSIGPNVLLVYSAIIELQVTISISHSQRWYKKDNNSKPGVYLLQDYTNLFPASDEVDDQVQKIQRRQKQYTIEQRLRSIISSAKAKDESLCHLLLSVTELEVQCALQCSDPCKECIWCQRSIEVGYQPKSKHVPVANLSKYVEKNEENDLLENLKKNVLHGNISPHNALKYYVKWNNEFGIDPSKVTSHKDHVDSLCWNVEDKLIDLITSAISENKHFFKNNNDELFYEVHHHMNICKSYCQTFVGRDEVLKNIQGYFATSKRSPLVIHGPPGSGKTAIASMVTKMLRTWIPGDLDAVVVVRFVGTSPNSKTLRGLLHSVVCQINQAYGNKRYVLQDLNYLIQRLPRTLSQASEERPLVIILDSIDDAKTFRTSRRLSWLPIRLPHHVKVILTVSVEDKSRSLAELQDYLTDSSCFIGIPRLTEGEISELTRRLLVASNRTLKAQQWSILLTACGRSPYPLFATLATHQSSKWKSYTKFQEAWLGFTVKELVQSVFEKLEDTFGKCLVSHVLGYITVSRYGLSENELEDIMSCDDEVLNDLYEDCFPPVRRIPSLLWLRIREKLSVYFTERTIDNVVVTSWSHSQLKEFSALRYFVDDDKRKMLHSNIADYFLGAWSNGVKKPFVTCKMEFGKNDRLVAAQPLMLNDDTYNMRKLNELPYHLLQSDRLGTLKVKVLCNYDWLIAKLKATSYSQLQEDFKMALQKYPDDENITVVAETLSLSRDALQIHPHHLASQLVGRITKTAGLEELLKRARAPDITSLTPFLPFLSPPGCQLVHSMAGHTSTITSMDITQDGRYIATASVDESIHIWAVKDGVLLKSVDWIGKGIRRVNYANGDKLLVISYSNSLKFINAITLVTEYVLNIRGLHGKAPSFAIGGKGKKTAFLVRPGKLVIVDVAKGNTLSEIRDTALQRTCEDTKISARGDMVAYFNPNYKKKSIKVTSVHTVKPVLKSIKINPDDKSDYHRPGHKDTIVSDVAVTSSRYVIVICRNFNDVSIYDGHSLRLIRRIRNHSEHLYGKTSVHRIVYDDHNLAFPVQDAVAVWDLAGSDGKWYGLQHPTDVTGVASVDMKRFVTIATDHVVRIWDVSKDEEESMFIRNDWDSHVLMSKCFPRHGESTDDDRSVVNDDSMEVVTTSDVYIGSDIINEKTQYTFDVCQLLSDAHDIFYTDYSLYPSERIKCVVQQIEEIPGCTTYVLVKSKNNNQYSITILDLSTLTPVRQSVMYRSRHCDRETFDTAQIVTVNDKIAVVILQNTLVLVDFVDSLVLRTLNGKVTSDRIVLVNNREKIAAIEESREVIKLYNIETDEPIILRGYEKKCRVSRICASDDGMGIILVSQLESSVGVFHVWDVTSFSLMHVLQCDVDEQCCLRLLIGEMVLSRDSRYLCHAYKAEFIMVWDLENGDVVHRLQAKEKWRRVKTYVTTGTDRILVAYDNGTVMLWNISEANVIHMLNGHTISPTILKISSDGQRALSMTSCGYHDSERLLVLWNLQEGYKIGDFRMDYVPNLSYRKETVHLLCNGHLIVLPTATIGSPVTLRAQSKTLHRFEVPTEWPALYQQKGEHLVLDFSQAFANEEDPGSETAKNESETRSEEIKDGGEE